MVFPPERRPVEDADSGHLQRTESQEHQRKDWSGHGDRIQHAPSPDVRPGEDSGRCVLKSSPERLNWMRHMWIRAARASAADVMPALELLSRR